MSLSERAKREAENCTYCPKLCRYTCPVAAAEGRETVTPWALMRLVELVRSGDAPLDDEAAEIWQHCTGCGQCQTGCKHGQDVASAMWQARAWARDEGARVPALDAVVASFEARGAPQALPALPTRALGRVEESFDATSPLGYWPDCRTVARDPSLVLRFGRLITRLTGKKARLLGAGQRGPGCCGFPLRSAGAPQAFEAHWQTARQDLAGVSLIVTDCASLAAMGGEGRWAWPLGVRVQHAVAFLAPLVVEDPPDARLATERVMLHDSCVVGRHLKLYEATRAIVATIFEGAPQELDRAREDASCCGAEGLYPQVAPEGARRVAQALWDQVAREGGDALVCGQAGCVSALNALREDGAIDVLEATCLAYEV